MIVENGTTHAMGSTDSEDLASTSCAAELEELL